uniref:Beta-mannosidase n=1 Tax=Astatotilapia calliptera TaxID=8154 RepID=A0AAX7U0L8_ASTCA
MLLHVRLSGWACWCLFSGVFSVFSLQQRLTVNLNGKWRLSNSNGSLLLPAQVPGCVHSALQQQGYITDPYFRFNDVSYRWIALDNWTYTTTFTLSAELSVKQKVLLVFDGVDTVGSVSLNGIAVGKTNNMFCRHDFSVKDLLKDGENVLQVGLLSPILYASEQRKAHTSYVVPPECPPGVQKGECHVNFIRKEQSSFSWDWGPSFPTMGLWKGVRLEAFDILQLVQVSSVPLYNDAFSQWRVQIELLIDAVQTARGQLTLSIPELDSEQTFQTHFNPGKTKSNFTILINTVLEMTPVSLLCVISITRPRSCFIFFLHSGQSEYPPQVYFRTVELIQEPVVGSPGLSFYFRINGKPIFLKGSNWIPVHSFQDQVTPDVLKNLLQSAVDANMNALRVWGGGVYEQDLFYEICDELGIMVWQDFMFACAMYPTETDFIQTVREEVVQQVQRLKSHPSIIIWSGNNENEAALATDWFDIPASQRPKYIRDYVMLYVDNIKKLVQEEDQSRPFLVSSPTNGAESEQEGWVAENPYDPHYGDVHFYSYILDCWDWRTFPRTRFASEYGFQSWPSFSTLQPVSIKEDWSYGSNFTSHRQHHEDGNQQMILQTALHFHLPNATDPLKRFTDTLYITQVMQAQCVKTQTEFYRRSRSEIIEGKGHTMGALYWQLNDIWQAPSWSSIGDQQGPTNYHFLCSPKDAQGLRRPNITVKVEEKKTCFSVTLHSDSVAPFVWLDVGNIPGRFSSNGFLMVSRNRTVDFNAWRPTSVAELTASLTITSLRDIY